VKDSAIGSCCLLNEIGTETNNKFNMLCVFKIRYSHEECKDTYKGPVCNCKHGYKRKHGHCVGKKITDKHTHTFI
jgi:hypothetical protein